MCVTQQQCAINWISHVAHLGRYKASCSHDTRALYGYLHFGRRLEISKNSSFLEQCLICRNRKHFPFPSLPAMNVTFDLVLASFKSTPNVRHVHLVSELSSTYDCSGMIDCSIVYSLFHSF